MLHIPAPLKRLDALYPLDQAAREAIGKSCEQSEYIRRSRPVHIDKPRPLLIMDGWAARWRPALNTDHQLLSIVLPGDVLLPVGNDAPATVALTDVEVCAAPDASDLPSLQRALERSQQLDQTYLFSQIARLGGLSAYERLIDILAEIYERLLLAGRAGDKRFDLPLTQGQMGDLLAMTTVHLNRTLARLRTDCRELSWERPTVTITPGDVIDRRAHRTLATMLTPRAGADRT